MNTFKPGLTLVVLFMSISGYSNNSQHLSLEEAITDMMAKVKAVKSTYAVKKQSLSDRLNVVQFNLKNETRLKKKVDYLVQKDQLELALEAVEFEEEFQICKVRYIKGLQVVKILYEKVLSLDHHFASARTFSEINKLANPNSFPEFAQIKEVLRDSKKKNVPMELPSLLGANVFTSVTEVLINLSNSGLSRKEKDENLSEIECILDFTLRMHNDLHIIYFETSYLQAANDDVKTNIETLFREYTKSIGYYGDLSECRLSDNWELIESDLNAYVSEALNESDMTKSEQLVNLKFPIDRLVQFINQYNNFINDGKKYYQKFDIILESYENEALCGSTIPVEFKKLRGDIDIAIEKFGIAYRPVEINGSKMKEILYGLN